MYYSGMGLCSGHGNSVVIREFSLCPQSLLAKLTVLDSHGVQNDAGVWLISTVGLLSSASIAVPSLFHV